MVGGGLKGGELEGSSCWRGQILFFLISRKKETDPETLWGRDLGRGPRTDSEEMMCELQVLPRVH